MIGNLHYVKLGYDERWGYVAEVLRDHVLMYSTKQPHNTHGDLWEEHLPTEAVLNTQHVYDKMRMYE